MMRTPNLAFEGTRRQLVSALRRSGRRAAQLIRWASAFKRPLRLVGVVLARWRRDVEIGRLPANGDR